MWYEKFKDKTGKTKYRFYEKFKDPYTDKWRRVSVVMNKDTKASQREAMFQLDELINKKKSQLKPDKHKSKITFSELMDEWLHFYANTSGTKATWHTKLQHFINRINKDINMDILAKNIDRKIVQDLLIKIVNEYNYSTSYSKKLFFVIKSSLHFAKENYNIDNTQFLDNIVLPKKVQSREYLEKKRFNYLENNELSEVLRVLEEMIKTEKRPNARRNKLIVRYQVELQALTGLRIGEVQALQNNDFDEMNKILSVNGSIQWIDSDDGYGVKDTTKTEGSYRTIDLDDRSIKILKLMQLENRKLELWTKDFNNRQFIFPNSKGNPLHNNIHSGLLKRVKHKVFGENSNRQLTTHTFRHTHISLLTELGLPLKAIMERVGHVDERTTLRIYTHVTTTLKRDIITKLNNVSF
ncbi:tyrosine-type recombinase/integrase [Staphylococcus xylosus]|uniref:tyrosine-type recombinase/integrase n=1 Tax=Staphylococcus xylosus TaxID=1288 RepID=UPI001C3ECEC3|nr:site-specific integrase [Staphylococcus xylosus]